MKTLKPKAENVGRTIFVDRLASTVGANPAKWRWAKACHMFCDDDKALHSFAARLGLKPEWAQRSRSGFLHYDLAESKRRRAVKLGAVECDRQEIYAAVKKSVGHVRVRTRKEWPE